MKTKLLKSMRAFLVAAGLVVGANAWAQVTTWTYSTTLANNTFGAEFSGSQSGIVTVQLGAASEASNWSIMSYGSKNRGVKNGTGVTLSTEEESKAIPTSGTYAMVKPVVDVWFSIQYFNGATKQKYRWSDAAAPTTINESQYNMGAGNTSTVSLKLLAGHTYYFYSGSNEYGFVSFTAKKYNYYLLEAEITSATTIKNTEGYDQGADDLAEAITAAQAVLANGSSTDDDYIAATASLREAKEYFYAINSMNTSYRTASTSAMDDGTNVKSVYGITMTYHGTWTWTNERNGNASAQTDPQSSDLREGYVPTGGEYIELKPAIDGYLTLKFAWYDSRIYRVVTDKGHLVFNYTHSGSNDYDNYKEAGFLQAGKTYYVYKASGTYGYYFGGFTFTPGEKTATSYAVNDYEVITGGDVVDEVTGITMTYGGTSDETWQWLDRSKSRGGFYNQGNATVSGVTPTAKTYLVFKPTANGVLTISGYIYNGNEDCTTYLSDGVSREALTQGKGSVGSKKYDRTFSTILKAGDTYYVYFYEKSYTSSFNGFTYDTSVPASVPATIGSTGFATFCSEYPLDFSATDAKAYTTSLTSDKTVLLTKVGAVPAGTGLLLKGATDDIPVKAGFVSKPETNLFVAVTEDNTAVAATDTENNSYNYVLAKSESKGVGFYNVKDDGKTLNAGKAYLHTTEALAANTDDARVAWIFSDEETTGIVSATKLKTTEQVVYNLNGQQVSQPAKGLYIVNGKKMVIK